jgi:hypothetical protein
MKSIWLILIILATFVPRSFAQESKISGPTITQRIEIKGVMIGMTPEELEAKVGRMPIKNFTIGGVEGNYDFKTNFHKGQLDRFLFFFHSSRFDELVAAVKGKYPELECENSTVSNRMGAKFQQTVCVLNDELTSLSITRFSGDVRTADLDMVSKREIQDRIKRAAERKKDM